MHPQTDDQNANLAFRPREKDKMKLRRNNRANDFENLMKVYILYFLVQISKERIRIVVLNY